MLSTVKIHHNVIGIASQVEGYPGGLDSAIAQYEATKESKVVAVIVTMAMHYYGLSFVDDYNTVEDLIADIRAIDEDLKFA